LNCEPARLSSNDLRSQPMAFSISFPHLIASIVGFGPSLFLVGLSPSLWCRGNRVTIPSQINRYGRSQTWSSSYKCNR
jgi:hypothetical protein